MTAERLAGERGPEKLDIKTARLGYTGHALSRFRERWKPLDEFDVVPENDAEWVEKFEAILHDSTEVSLGNTATVKRLIDNDFKDVRYFLNEVHNLRFVVRLEGDRVHVITVENPFGD